LVPASAKPPSLVAASEKTSKSLREPPKVWFHRILPKESVSMRKAEFPSLVRYEYPATAYLPFPVWTAKLWLHASG
jgi:hypothetical protein